MDFLKKAKAQVSVAVKEVKDISQQYKTQYQPHPQHGPPQYFPQQQTYVPNGASQHQPYINTQSVAQQYGYQPQQQHYPPPPQPAAYGYQQSTQTFQQHHPPPSQQFYHQQQPVSYPSVPQSPPLHTPHYSPPHGQFASPAGYSTYPPQAPPQALASTQHGVGPVITPSSNQCAAVENKLTDYVQFYVLNTNLLERPGQPSIPQTAITFCQNCFQSHISQHHDIAASFVPLARELSDNADPESHISYREAVCHFNIPRVRQSLYQKCVLQNSIWPLVNDANSLSILAGCAGAGTESSSEYYTSREIDGLTICPTCFQFYVASTTFESHFMRVTNPPHTWLCDIATRGAVYRALTTELLSGQPNFDRFATRTRERFALPHCPGEGKAIAETGSGPAYSYGGVGGRTGNFCQACFRDHVENTNMEQYFNRFLQLSEGNYGSLPCDLASKYSKFAMKVAIQRNGDYDTWLKPLSLMQKLPNCAGIRGVDEGDLQDGEQVGDWYCMTQFPSIEICPRCYHTALELYGAAYLFSPVSRSLRPGFIRVCTLTASKKPDANTQDYRTFENTVAYRGMILRHALSHGWIANDGQFKAFRQLAEEIATTFPPPCTGNERLYFAINGRKWFGRFKVIADPNDFSLCICEECWLDYVKDTPLHSILSTDTTEAANRVPEGFSCNTYTMRAKRELEEASKSGDWQRFMRYWHEREEVKGRFDAVSNRFKQQIELRNLEQDAQMQSAMISHMQQLTANTNAVIAGIGGSVAEAANTNYSTMYGNPSIGYGHYTAAGANAAQAYHDAANMPKPSLANFVSSGDAAQDTENMKVFYVAVRAEWLAIE